MAHERQLQAVRLERDEALAKLQRVTDELQRTRQRASNESQQLSALRLEAVFRTVAGPAAQIMAQNELHRAGCEIALPDALRLARQLVRVLETEGLRIEGQAGEVVAYDERLHEPLADVRIAPGEPVVIRIGGVWFEETHLRKAGVEPQGRD